MAAAGRRSVVRLLALARHGSSSKSLFSNSFSAAKSASAYSRSHSISAASRGYHTEWDYRGQRQILPIAHMVPDVAVDGWVAPNAVLAGDVLLQDRATVWHGSVLRADLNKITVGFSSNILDKCVLHVAAESPTGLSAELSIGKFVTVGGFSTLRSCTIEDEVIIGQRCVLMEGSWVESHAFLGSGSVVPPGRRIPAGELWAGNPAKFVRLVTADEIADIPKFAESIRTLAQEYADEFLPYSTAYLELERLRKKLGQLVDPK
ncbi:hypothetical protein O6H91_21G026600 [Diphasiastrum complanatum]|uniref:Uncharacterized protein n=2 Tax=Diphasiastrum complanatum TaxID=34168 RepID=A0ACC2AIY8_DIPCM|nr:hypothetical protein O6H91_21G009100 [Diphasiastrum complanatum]KAJ7517496.1 hypothetical protein O6H91_21G026600 [Diphasiastrum complanatum]